MITSCTLNPCNSTWLHLRDRVKRLCNRRFPRRLDKLERRVFMLRRQSGRSLSFQQRSHASFKDYRTKDCVLSHDSFASTTHVHRRPFVTGEQRSRFTRVAERDSIFATSPTSKALCSGIETPSSILKQSFSRGWNSEIAVAHYRDILYMYFIEMQI